jgi:predicted transposase YdaD
VVDTAHDDGLKLGRAEGQVEGKLENSIEIAQELLPIMNDQQIADITGLTIEQIQKLRDAET